jgi:hypothetical protein
MELPARGVDGPQDFYSTLRPVAPSQWRLVAQCACALFGEPLPSNRYEASVLAARMKVAIENDPKPAAADARDEVPV